MADSDKECAADLMQAIEDKDVKLFLKCFVELRDSLPGDDGSDDKDQDDDSDDDSDDSQHHGSALLIGLGKPSKR